MKVIYLHQYFTFPHEMGGTRSYDLAKSFIAHGNSVTVLSSTSDSQYHTNKKWTVIEKDGISVHYIYLPYNNQMSYRKRMKVFVQFLFYTSLRILKFDCDIVLASSTPLTIGIPALVKKWKNKTPFIFEARDVWPEAVIAIGVIKNKVIQQLLYKLERTIYKNAAAIVPLSTDMKKSIITRYPEICKNKPVVVIENIAEINRFVRSKKKAIIKELIGFQPRFTVLYAGTFGKVNGIDYVIELAKKTQAIDQNIVYILIGDGARKEIITEKAKKYNVLYKNVFILNPVRKQDLPDWYREVDMGSSFVIPIKELWANSANKFFDTLAASRPILINHKGWQAEVIRNDNLGFVLPEKLTEESASEFVEYTQKRALHQEQQKNALKKAKEFYSLEIASQKYVTIFQKVLSIKQTEAQAEIN